MHWRGGVAVALAVVGVGSLAVFAPWSPSGMPPSSDVPLSLPRVRDASRQGFPARAAVVIDGETGALLAEHNAFAPYPMASLAKLMTAVVVLDRGADLAQEVTILPTEYTLRGGNLRLAAGERVTVRDLLVASITGSANNAAFALPRALGMTDAAFTESMNRKAVALGLETLHFTDSAGWSPENVGSAYDVARLAATALRKYSLIAEAARSPQVTLSVRGATERAYDIRHSNPLLAELGPEVFSKTGYLHESLFCLVLARRVGGRLLVAVVLGHPDEYGVIREAERLLREASGV